MNVSVMLESTGIGRGINAIVRFANDPQLLAAEHMYDSGATTRVNVLDSSWRVYSMFP